MSVSNISNKNKYLLWAITGGRCQYRGCNQPLTKDILTKKKFNKAYIAHIVADVPGGPRGDATRSPLLADDINNLMLLCDTHHRLIDIADVSGHPETLLLEMKKEHEERIERLTAIAPNMSSHIVIYKANIGLHSPFLSYEAMAEYLLPNHYPAISSSIDLGLTDSPFRDKDAHFWQTELQVLEENYNLRLRDLLRQNKIRHISLFALAPIPLLVKLGTLINEIHNIEIHQPIRNPQTWNLSDDSTTTKYIVMEPSELKPIVALNISLSASITNDRITNVLGDDCSVYTLTIDNPNPNYLQNKIQLQDFKSEVQKLLNYIKSKYNAETPLHVFAAMPVATSIEFGRSWFPKADMPLYLYDQNTANNGFTKVIEIINN